MKKMKGSEIKSQINQKFKPINQTFKKNFAEMEIVEETTNIMLGRYFILSFTYRINNQTK